MRHIQQKQIERQEQEIKAYNRLARAKAEKPYHVRYYWLYIFLIVLGWFANAISGITEASKIYSFFHAFLNSFDYGKSLSWSAVIVSVVLLELLNRFLAVNYFREYVENDGHDRSMTWNLVAMLGVSGFSLFLSFTGGFDLVRLTNEKPQQVQAEKLEIVDVENAYSPILSEMKEDIQEYKSTRQWQGRLSDDSAKKWEDMKQQKQEIQVQMAGALSNLSISNLENQVRADSLNHARLNLYEEQVSDRGYGLGFLTLFFIAVLYFCIWYNEQYVETKTQYLENKYGKMEDGKVLSTLVQEKQTTTKAVATNDTDRIAHLEETVMQVASLVNQMTTQNPQFVARENTIATEQLNGVKKN